MQGRTYESFYEGMPHYRYGFNSQENDDEAKGYGNVMGAEFWEYDTRIGRRWNIDPKPMTGVSPYSAFNNNPILFSDPLGDTLNNAQVVDAIKIASNEIRDALKSNRDYHAKGTNERLLGAVQKYAEKHYLNLRDFTDFTAVVDQYHNALATVA